MRCLHAIFTLLPEALKRSKMKKMAKAKRLPVCCEFHSARSEVKKRGRALEEAECWVPAPGDSGEARDAGPDRDSETVSRPASVDSSTELAADVYFVVGPADRARRIPAHKHVLAAESRVFHAMFHGDASEDKDEFNFPDVDPVSFLCMIRCIYSDAPALREDTALSTLLAAERFAVPRVARTCRAFLEGALSHRNACAMLARSLALRERALAERCWELIDAQAELALGSPSFLELDRGTVESILRRESLTAREARVFDAALAWSAAECRRRGLEATPRNQRKALGGALHLVRIPVMSVEEFANGAAQSGLLSAEETNSIFLFYTARHKPTLEFQCAPRRGLTPSRCLRFRSSCNNGGSGGFGADGRHHQGGGGGRRSAAVRFKVDRRIFLAGLGLYGLYGPASRDAECSVAVDVTLRGATLARLAAPPLRRSDGPVRPVMFEHAVQVEPHVLHTASVVLAGAEFGAEFGASGGGEDGDGLAEVRCSGVVFLFESDGAAGGVPGRHIAELLFYA